MELDPEIPPDWQELLRDMRKGGMGRTVDLVEGYMEVTLRVNKAQHGQVLCALLMLAGSIIHQMPEEAPPPMLAIKRALEQAEPYVREMAIDKEWRSRN